MRERPLFVLAVSCVLGEVLAAFSLKTGFTAAALSSFGLQLFLAAALFAWQMRAGIKKDRRRIWKACLFFISLLLGFWTGFFGCRNSESEYAQDLSEYEGTAVTITGTVTYAEEREKGAYYYLKNVTVYADGTASGQAASKAGREIAAYRKALVIDYDYANAASSGEDDAEASGLSESPDEAAGTVSCDSAFFVGKQVSLAAVYGAMNTASNPGNYDEKSYYESRGIGLKVTLEEWKTVQSKGASAANLLYRVRLALHKRFYELTDETTADFYCGMILGEGYEISSEEKDIFRTGGIGHILAISGLHISLIGMAIYRLLRGRFCEGAAVTAAILILAFYGSLTGGSPSALRAIGMFALRILAKKCGRRFDFLSAAGFSAYTILLAEPAYLFYSGFQMSFCAVFGAALVTPMVQKYLRVSGSVRKALVSGLVIQGVILPVQLYYFYQIAPYSTGINLIVIPSMGVLLGAGILGVLIGPVWMPAGRLLLGAGGMLLKIYAWLCEKTLALPGGLLITGAPSGVRIALFYAILAAVCMKLKFTEKSDEKQNSPEKERTHLLNIRALEFRVFFPWFRGKDRMREKIHEEKVMGPRMPFAVCLRRISFLGCVLAVAILILTGRSRAALQTVFLDVGQGNAIFLESAEGTTWLVDGGSSSETDVGTYRILPFLKWEGVAKIDYMVLTHVDSDHYSGLIEILEQAETGVGVGCLLVPDMADLDENYQVVVQTAEENGVPVYRLMTGVDWQENNLKITCVWPDTDADFSDTNEGSGVLFVTCGEFSMLLTGDIGEETENILLNSGVAGDEISRITVLGVPHHGSKYSSSEAFLSALAPRIAVISVGKNLYGHPAEETILRLSDAGAAVCTTMDCGAVILTTDGEKVTLNGYKKLLYREP